jgi:hypothetical protein
VACIGKGASLEAEEFGLEQRLGNGGAVDRDERPAPPGPRFVGGPGEESFPSPRLADDQDIRKAARLRLAPKEQFDLRPGSYQARAITNQFGQQRHGARILSPLVDFHHQGAAGQLSALSS